MNYYKCVVYDENSKRKVINLEFDNQEDVLKYTKENGFKLSSIKKKESIFNQNLKPKELKILCNQIGILFESGCEITKLLEILEMQSKKKLKMIIRKILKGIEEGNSITDSFKNTNAFSKFFINLVYVGEQSSNLDEIMYRLSEYYDKEAKIKSKMISIMIYPIILIIVTIASILMILIFIMPKYESIYLENNIEVPTITKGMIFLSHFLMDNYIIIFLAIFTFVISSIYILKNNQELRKKIHQFILKIPKIGDYILLNITNRFSQSLCILIKSGVEIVSAIDISAKVIDKNYIYETIFIANESIKEGNSIGESLGKINLFPTLFITMLIVGESTGRLESTLDTVNKFYENELNEAIEIGMKYFEMAIILVMGVVVGVTVISMVIPMFTAVSSF